MVKHIILWQLKDEYSDAEKADIKAGIKAGLEGLAGQIPGLVEVHVNINGLPGSILRAFCQAQTRRTLLFTANLHYYI